MNVHIWMNNMRLNSRDPVMLTEEMVYKSSAESTQHSSHWINLHYVELG